MSKVDATTQRVQRILTDYIGRVELDNQGFTFAHQSTRVFVRIFEIDEEFTMVSVSAPIAFEVPITWELYQWVARNTNNFNFGHIGLVEEPAGAFVLFRHSVLGDFLDPEELKWAVGAVAHTADQLDDEVVGTFGGKRYIDT